MTLLRDILLETVDREDAEQITKNAKGMFEKALAKDVLEYVKDEFSHAKATGKAESFGKFARSITKEQFVKWAENDTKNVLDNSFAIYKEMVKTAKE